MDYFVTLMKTFNGSSARGTVQYCIQFFSLLLDNYLQIQLKDRLRECICFITLGLPILALE